MKITFIGLTISSSWGNGHATTYRGLVSALANLGHEVHFLEHDKPWYSKNRDFSQSDSYHLQFYKSIPDLKNKYAEVVRTADMVIVGSYVPEGVKVCKWVLQIAEGLKAFYDIDTPVTLELLDQNNDTYLEKALIPHFDLYLSFSGGEVLDVLEQKYGAQKARALYCSVDPDIYYPMVLEKQWSLGYLGTYSDDRQPSLQSLLIEPAKHLAHERFVVAGPSYPDTVQWPENVTRIDHLPPHLHCKFYNRQRITLNITRQAMVKLGYSPSVRLFEAAACGVPLVSDYWKGLTDLFEEGKEILIAKNAKEMKIILTETSDEQLIAIGNAARKKVLNSHTAAKRAIELIAYYEEVKGLVETSDV